MNSFTSYKDTRSVMGESMIGFEEIRLINEKFRMKTEKTDVLFQIREDMNEIPYSLNEIEQRKNDYLLIFGTSRFTDGTDVSIRNLRRIFGMDPSISEPCFYNQDWYENETFIDTPMDEGWFFIRKRVFEETRSRQPNELMRNYRFPSAIKCAYSFFIAWLALGIKLWYHDFVWCFDTDHNGDRIYVGKYNDVDNMNKNGFSIHRHLEIRNCYGCID